MWIFRGRLVLILATLLFFFLNHASAQDLQKWEETISKFEKADQESPIKKGKYIVFTGSSSIVGWENLEADFPDKRILNRGFGGSQTFEVLHFADRIITPYKPKQVVIYAGDNDIADGKSPETVLADFEALFNKIRKANKRTFVSFISIKPSPSRKHYMPKIVEANQLVGEFLKTKKRTSYVDIYTPMLLPNGNPKPELFKADSLHMVKAGYDLWREVLRPHLK
jgi:lysophospholipase L1-like esterase